MRNNSNRGESGKRTKVSLSRENLIRSIRDLSYLPRWIVVGIDLMVLVFSFFFTKLVLNGVGLHFITFENKVPYISFWFSQSVINGTI